MFFTRKFNMKLLKVWNCCHFNYLNSVMVLTMTDIFMLFLGNLDRVGRFLSSPLFILSHAFVLSVL